MIGRGLSKLIAGIILIPVDIYAYITIHEHNSFKTPAEKWTSVLIFIGLAVVLLLAYSLIRAGIMNLRDKNVPGEKNGGAA